MTVTCQTGEQKTDEQKTGEEHQRPWEGRMAGSSEREPPRHIAVIDIGKTNAKVALVEAATLTEMRVVSRPNRPLPGPPYPHMDLDGLWQFILAQLAFYHREEGVDAISITTHGAAGVLLGETGLAAPMLDYEYPLPDEAIAAYQALRPAFSETGSPPLPLGLNLGAQLHWLLARDAELAARVRHVVTYPQYWLWQLTGAFACDPTSLGCHTDLWNPWLGKASSLVERLGLADRLAPATLPGQMFSPLRPEVIAATGLAAATPVTCGIHDSNASLYPHLLGRAAPFAVVSTGTWVVAMAVGGAPVKLDPNRDVLVNVSALGQPVPSARFMGGREFEIVSTEPMPSVDDDACQSDLGRPEPQTGTDSAVLPPSPDTTPNEADRAAVLTRSVMLLPSVQPGSGPFPQQTRRWTTPPQSQGERRIALCYYIALMTRSCLDLIGARGPVIVEGPFAQNPDYLAMLAAICPDGVETSASATGTSIGAALLCLPSAAAPKGQKVPSPENAEMLRRYAEAWKALANRDFKNMTAQRDA